MIKQNLSFASIFFCAVTIVSLFPISTTFAQTATEGAGMSASNSATTDELRKRIERVVEERREQIKGVVEDLLVKKGAYVGEISRISEEAITIKSNETTTIIPLTDELVILQNNEPLDISTIEVGNWAAVLGNRSDNTIEPEYVLVSEKSLRPPTQFVRLGSIKKITRNELVFTPRGTEEETTIAIQKTTKFQDADGETAVMANFEEELNVLVTATQGKDGWELKTVRSLAPLGEHE